MTTTREAQPCPRFCKCDNCRRYAELLDAMREIGRAPPAAHPQPVAVSGEWVMVPRIPTALMIEEGEREIAFGNDLSDAWEAMIRDAKPAAPPHPEPESAAPAVSEYARMREKALFADALERDRDSAIERAEAAEQQLAVARDTNRKLHRRCQDAEAALPEYHRLLAVPPDGDGVRFVMGNLGRILLGSYCTKLQAELEQAEAALREAREEVKRLTTPDMFWDAEDGERFGNSVEEVLNDFDPGSVVEIAAGVRTPSFTVRLLDDEGNWEEVHPSAETLTLSEQNSGGRKP